LREIFSSIQKQTGYQVDYNKRFLQHIEPVSVSANRMPLERSHELLLHPQTPTYEIREKKITINRDHTPSHNKKAEVQIVVQERVYSGKVTDEEGVPLAGISVSIKGAGVSTGTDEQGNYQLKTTGQNPIFAFSGLGYAPQEIAVGQDQVVNVTMRAMVSDLEEVVVVGYGTQRRA